MKKHKWKIIAGMFIIVLLILIGRIHARLWKLEETQAFDHAAIIIYLHPDEKVVECYQEFLWREQAKNP